MLEKLHISKNLRHPDYGQELGPKRVEAGLDT